ncbi:hypothetical protein ACSQIU_005196, partial [Escherichia coli]
FLPKSLGDSSAPGMCAFYYFTNCKEVNHDKSFINDSLQTFPGLILFFLPWIRLPFPDFYIYIL